MPRDLLSFCLLWKVAIGAGISDDSLLVRRPESLVRRSLSQELSTQRQAFCARYSALFCVERKMSDFDHNHYIL